MRTVQEVLAFWFGDQPSDAVTTSKEKHTLWWSKNDSVDLEVRDRFLGLVEQAAAGDLVGWKSTPRGRLALILLTDQFPRNIFRGSRRSFAYDKLALGWCLDGLSRHVDSQLLPIERWFFYLPLQHSESTEHQDRSVERYTRLLDEVDESEKGVFGRSLDYAIRHRDVVSKFGRFPHRNKLLEREPTAAELAFLSKPGSSF